MAWSTLPTYADGNALTAAQMLAIAANINESAPAKATTQGYWFISGSSANTINERAILQSEILTQETSGRTTYGNIATVGPTVTITTGTQALISTTAQMFNSGANNMYMSYAVSGATTSTSVDDRALAFQAGAGDQIRATCTTLQALTAGSNVCKAEYKTTAGTGTWDDRRILVMAM
jgi:hypothetical protein